MGDGLKVQHCCDFDCMLCPVLLLIYADGRNPSTETRLIGNRWIISRRSVHTGLVIDDNDSNWTWST
jgi:hypothetical protein